MRNPRSKRLSKGKFLRGDEAKRLGFEPLQAEAKTASKARLKELYRPVADDIFKAIAKLEPCEDKAVFP